MIERAPTTLPLRRLAGALAAAVLVAVPGVASGQGLGFEAPRKLPNSPPGASTMQGGEPSVAFDGSGDGHVYVVAPGGSDRGINFWASADHGLTFPIAKTVGSQLGGGDSDIEVGIDHAVYAADLEVVANAVCRSHDFGKTFGDNCETNVPTNQQGPESDREWISHDPTHANVLYFTYHDFAGEVPIIEKSTDGGQTFSPCGSITQPGSQQQQDFTTGGTDVGKPVIGRDGSIYVPVTEPSSPLVTGAYNNFFVAVAKGGCDGSTVFTDYVIHSDPGANLANIFTDLAIDGGGTLYAAASGKLKAGDPGYGTYVFTSTDGGQHWASHQVNSPNLKANVLPGLAGGLARGEVAVDWYGTETSGDPNNPSDQWRYYAATSFDGGSTWSQATVTPTPFHFGDVCTQGILCSGNRNLLDFSSIAVDPSDGSVFAVFPGDPYDTPQNQATDPAAAYVAKQISGPQLAASGAGSSPSTPPSTTHRAPCVDRRKFTFRLHHAKRAHVVAVDVFINGRRVLHKRARALTKVTLNRLPRGTFTLKIVAKQSTGSTITSVRNYRGCKKTRPRTRSHHHRRR